jgi:Domain of unknown function (DUF5615)
VRGKSIKLLLDEHIWEGLTEALTPRGYDVVHISNTQQRGIDDEPLLAFATAEGRAVLTYNARHFVPLVRLWYEAGRAHAGVILSVQLRQPYVISSKNTSAAGYCPVNGRPRHSRAAPEYSPCWS